jgi:hypothetical protein
MSGKVEYLFELITSKKVLLDDACGQVVIEVVKKKRHLSDSNTRGQSPTAFAC